MKGFLAYAAAGLLLAGCMSESEPEEEGEHLLVKVIDLDGNPQPADTVYWSYSPDSVNHLAGGKAAHGGAGDTVMHGATCANTDCSEWEIHEHVHGNLYLRGRYVRTGALCFVHMYGIKHLDADTLSGEVTLVLEETLTDCL